MNDSPQDMSLGLDVPAQPSEAGAYRVLARAYRPQTFSELIGQDAMVQTLANAIKRNRLAHAFLMTGVRGVGKTSTARLIAKALNCTGPDGNGGPTIDPCGVCESCKAIAEGRHIDVIEMDAASHTGVDDVREIIEAVRYAAVSARFKIYIIDEVHMLSRNAFNALLKTLEEPPAHVKFLFATTEVNKVPITVLSRCQRFDLRRIPVELLREHFAGVSASEGVNADEDALAMIAIAAEGSARDGLSILDQAIAHAELHDGRPHITAAQVRAMLGLSDRGSARRLLEFIIAGDSGGILDLLAEQDSLGVEPVATINALLDLVHSTTMEKVGKGTSHAMLAEAERDAIARWSASLSNPALHRLWQLLLKAHEEVAAAARPLAACEMALLRLVHAAAMPDPGELARLLKERGLALEDRHFEGTGAEHGPVRSGNLAEAKPTEVQPTSPDDFPSLVAALDRHAPLLANQLRDCVGLVRFEPYRLCLRQTGPLDPRFASEMREQLRKLDGKSWQFDLVDEPAAPSLREQGEADAEAKREKIRATPIVAAALAAFPGSMLSEPDETT